MQEMCQRQYGRERSHNCLEDKWLAGATGTVLLALEVAGLVYALGKVFEKIDPSALS